MTVDKDFCFNSNWENHRHMINRKTGKCYWCGKKIKGEQK